MKRKILGLLAVPVLLIVGSFVRTGQAYAAKCYIDAKPVVNGVMTDTYVPTQVKTNCSYDNWAGAGYLMGSLPNPFPAGDGTCIYFPNSGTGQVVSCSESLFANAPIFENSGGTDSGDGVVGNDDEARKFCETALKGTVWATPGASGQGSDSCYWPKISGETCTLADTTNTAKCNSAPLASMVGNKESDLKNLFASSATGAKELDGWLQRVINLLSMIVGLVVVLSIAYAGIQYMTAGSNASQVSAAKNRIMMSILALVLFGFTYTLLQWLVPGGIF